MNFKGSFKSTIHPAYQANTSCVWLRLGEGFLFEESSWGRELAGSAVIHMDLWLAKHSRYVSVPPYNSSHSQPPPPPPLQPFPISPLLLPTSLSFSLQPHLVNQGQIELSSNLLLNSEGNFQIFLCLGINLHLDYSCTAPLMAQQA